MSLETMPLYDMLVISSVYFVTFFVASWLFQRAFPLNNVDLNTYTDSEYLKLLGETLLEVFGFCVLIGYLKPLVNNMLSETMHMDNPTALAMSGVAVMMGAGPFKSDLGLKLKILQNYLDTNF